MAKTREPWGWTPCAIRQKYGDSYFPYDLPDNPIEVRKKIKKVCRKCRIIKHGYYCEKLHRALVVKFIAMRKLCPAVVLDLGPLMDWGEFVSRFLRTCPNCNKCPYGDILELDTKMEIARIPHEVQGFIQDILGPLQMESPKVRDWGYQGSFERWCVGKKYKFLPSWVFIPLLRYPTKLEGFWGCFYPDSRLLLKGENLIPRVKEAANLLSEGERRFLYSLRKRYGRRGLPDYFVYRGRPKEYFFVEVKSPKGRFTPLQIEVFPHVSKKFKVRLAVPSGRSDFRLIDLPNNEAPETENMYKQVLNV